MTEFKFTKMHGAGNDYIYVYTPQYPINDPATVSRVLSKQHFGIGSDGLILIGKSDIADFSMRIFNNDGSEAMMCGNGVRCCGKFVRDHQLTQKSSVTFDTLSGIKTIQLHDDENGIVHSATVDMGAPLEYKPLTIDQHNGTFVSMGNPHFVQFVENVMEVDLTANGSVLECHSAFPNKCNIEYAQVVSDNTIRMRVWERGSGITLACGTGACATAVAAFLTGRCGRESDVQMDGGTLHIRWDENDNHIYMTGPAETVFEGVVKINQ